jgi:alpha-galactosidase
VHADLADPETLLSGSVSLDRTHALFSWVRLDSSGPGQAGRVPFPGLDAARDYDVRVRDDLGEPSLHQGGGPVWFDEARRRPVRIPGVVLATVGIPLPTLNPGQALLLELTAG